MGAFLDHAVYLVAATTFTFGGDGYLMLNMASRNPSIRYTFRITPLRALTLVANTLFILALFEKWFANQSTGVAIAFLTGMLVALFGHFAVARRDFYAQRPDKWNGT